MKRIAQLLWMLLAAGVAESPAASPLKSDEKVVLYPALARPTSTGWEIQIHGIIYEPERQRVFAALMRRVLGIDEALLTPVQRATLRERCQYFLADNEHGKELFLEFGRRTYRVGTSAANGHFEGSFRVKTDELIDEDNAQGDTNFLFRCKIGSPGQPLRSTLLEIQFVTETGLSVISDIDDTIKISEVRDRGAMIENTFYRPFKPVPGMAGVYREWAGAGARFHYLTASPWQLYLPLSSFVHSNGFPAGTFHMKNFRLKDGSFRELFQSPEDYKPPPIERLLKQFPKRRFVLVGDSGEKDPEIYGAVTRKHREQVLLILIRDVTDQPADSPRYQRAFEGLPRDQWRIFKDPAEIKARW